MRLLLLVFFALSGLLTATQSLAQARELRIALGVADARAPQGAGQTGGLAAFNEDLGREICRRINARCTTVNIVFADILPGIEAQAFELGFGNYLRTPERERRVAFSDTIWRSSSRLVARLATVRRFAAGPGQEVTLGSLRDARLAVVADTQQQAYLQGLPGDRGLTVVPARTMDETLSLVRDGKADFGLLPMLSAYAMLNREPAGDFEFVGPPLTEGGLGGSVHIALPKADAALRQAVNQGIASLRADGTYHRIVRRHFPFSLD